MNNETFEQAVVNSIASVQQVEGHLTNREIRCLTLLAAVPSTKGTILEIGSFKGRSTIVLAKSAALAGETKIVAVDPLTSPSKTCPDLCGQTSGWCDFQANLKNAGVTAAVEFHQEFSQDLAAKWDAWAERTNVKPYPPPEAGNGKQGKKKGQGKAAGGGQS